MRRIEVLEDCWLGNELGSDTEKVIAYDEMAKGDAVKLSCAGEAAIVLINARILYDKKYTGRVQKAMLEKEPRFSRLDPMDVAGWSMKDALVAFLCCGIERGHYNPDGVVVVSLDDLSSYRGEYIWQQVANHLEECGEPHRVYKPAGL